MTHQWSDVPPVQTHRCEGAVPADGIEWVVRVGDGAQPAAAFDDNLPFAFTLLSLERRVDPRRIEHGGVKDGMAADDKLVRKTVDVAGRFNKEDSKRLGKVEAKEGSPGKDHIISGVDWKMKVVEEKVQ